MWRIVLFRLPRWKRPGCSETCHYHNLDVKSVRCKMWINEQQHKIPRGFSFSGHQITQMHTSMAVLGASCPANHQCTYPLHGTVKFQGKIIVFNIVDEKQVDCIVAVTFEFTFVSPSLRHLWTSETPTPRLDICKVTSTRTTYHAMSMTRPGALESYIVFFGLNFLAKKEGLNRTWNHYIPNLKGEFWIYPPTQQRWQMIEV